MHLLYVDESGKSGLRDPQQPWYILAGVIVDEVQWLGVEADLGGRVDAIVPPPRPDKWEIHASDLMYGKGLAGPLSRRARAELIEAVLDVLDGADLKLEFVVIDKRALRWKYKNPLPPEDLAYQFMIERFEYFLGNHPETPLGIVVSDEQKGQEESIRSAHRHFREKGSTFGPISRIVETPFFAPSHASCMLQIADVCAYYCNRFLRAERAKKANPPEWDRLYVHIDRRQGRVVGLKRFP